MLSPRKIDFPSSADIERAAYNAAFHELGLRWHWDARTYEQLSALPCERSRLRHYLEQAQPHLLRAYDADFLAEAILQAKERRQAALAGSSNPGLPLWEWSEPHQGEVGI